MPGGSLLTQGLKDLAHLLIRFRLLAVGPDDKIGKRGLFTRRLLGGDDLAGSCFAEASGDQAFELEVVSAGRNDHAIEVRGVASLVKEGDFGNRKR